MRSLNSDLPHVVIIGGGFGGSTCAPAQRRARARDRGRSLQSPPVSAAALPGGDGGLSPADIAAPIRTDPARTRITSGAAGRGRGVDFEAQRVGCTIAKSDYDYLVLAAGARTSYFGHDEWEKFAPGPRPGRRGRDSPPRAAGLRGGRERAGPERRAS